MTFINATSAHGTNHQSDLEKRAAERWLPLGYITHDKPLPVPFFDKKGEQCEGRSDFLEDTFGFLIECKGNHLNSRTAKVFAERGMLRHRERLSRGVIKPNSRGDHWGILENGWNHAAAAIAAKQEACFAAGYGFLLIFTEKPDADTLELLDKYDILWLQERTHNFQQFNTWRKLARISGITVNAFPIKDWLINFDSDVQPSTDPAQWPTRACYALWKNSLHNNHLGAPPLQSCSNFPCESIT